MTDREKLLITKAIEDVDICLHKKIPYVLLDTFSDNILWYSKEKQHMCSHTHLHPMSD